MGSTTDKIKGYANQVAGNIKQGVGKATGSEELEVKGSVQNLKGKAQVAVGDVKEAVKDGANKAADEINRNL
ncbi:CsbD family protein [Hyphomicrobium sp. 1Nfss2.1]|uniref:CsbD family protein n=1 Tax=Hyphomicrobium sp. 1Nfss2.1 TaxID=3413936 RepID=UPI003C7C28EA